MGNRQDYSRSCKAIRKKFKRPMSEIQLALITAAISRPASEPETQVEVEIFRRQAAMKHLKFGWRVVRGRSSRKGSMSAMPRTRR